MINLNGKREKELDEILPPGCPERTWSKSFRKKMKKIREDNHTKAK